MLSLELRCKRREKDKHIYVNVIFTFSGIVLNTLVIASFWKSSQLRNKLSFYYHVVVVFRFGRSRNELSSNYCLILFLGWLHEDYDLLPKRKVYLYFGQVFLAFSMLVLLVMNIERYLGAYYPIFHCTSVTRRRLW